MSSLGKFIDGKIPLYSILEKAIPLVIISSGGGLSIILAKFSAWLANISPITYGLIFSAGAITTTCIYLLIQKAIKNGIIIKHANTLLSPNTANPLETKFEKKTIKLTDFFSPFYIPHKDKTFDNCEIVGPGNIFFNGCYLNSVTMVGCQIVILNNTKTSVINVTGFTNCTIINSKFISCTIFIDAKMYNSLPEKMQQEVAVVSGAS